MQVHLTDLINKSLPELIQLFANIPLHQTELELIGDFYDDYGLLRSLVSRSPYLEASRALPYLPKHITAVKFSGEYALGNGLHHETLSGMDYTSNYEFMHIGQALPKYCASLPPTVHKVSMAFQCTEIIFSREYHTIDALIKAVSSLNKNIKSLDLSGMRYDRVPEIEIVDLFSKIPQTMESLSVILPTEFLPSILRVLPQTITRLDFSGIVLGSQDQAYIQRFLNLLPEHLKSLHLGSCELGRFDYADLQCLISNLPPQLAILGLSNNEFFTRAQVTEEEFASSLSLLPPSIVEVDLGENYALNIRSDYLAIILAGFPKTVKQLRLSQKTLSLNIENAELTMDGTELAKQLSKIPSQVDTISFSGMNFFNLSASEFSKGLTGLPPTVRTLDFSNLTWQLRTHEELVSLFSEFPSHVVALKLCDNRLLSTNPVTVKKWLHAFAPQIKEIDFSGNGFDRLLPSQFNRFARCVPARITRVIFDRNQFAVQSHGALVVNPLSQYNPNLFKPRGAILHYQKLAELRLVMTQFLMKLPLPLEIVALIFSYALASTEQENKYIEKQLTQGLLISEKLPVCITEEIKQETISTALARIEIATRTQATQVDLSHCGLNRIDEAAVIEALFMKISTQTRELNLRANGLGQVCKDLTVVNMLFQRIPQHITYLNLSDNHFESYDAEQLRQLLMSLPLTVQLVSLDQEKPLSPAAHIALRKYPQTYEALTVPHDTHMKQARAILDDYTKGDSALWRLMYFHWKRRNTEKVALLVTRIDLGLITDIKDLLSELHLIEKGNEIGSLAKRISFLEQKSLKPIELRDGSVEMTSITSGVGV